MIHRSSPQVEGWGTEQLLDRINASDEHCDTIHANAKPTGWWHAVFEGPQIILIDGAAF